MRFFNKNVSLVLLAVLFVFVPLSLVHAQSTGGTTGGQSSGGLTGGQSAGGTTGGQSTGGLTGGQSSGGTLNNPLNAPDLQTLLKEVLAYVTVLASILLTIMLVYVGFKFVTAQGNPEAVSSAKSMLLWTVIGGILLLGANAIAIVVTSTASSL